MNKKVKKALYLNLLTLCLLCKNNDVYDIECATKIESVKEANIYNNFKKVVGLDLCAGFTKECFDYLEIIGKEHEIIDYEKAQSIQNKNREERQNIEENPITYIEPVVEKSNCRIDNNVGVLDSKRIEFVEDEIQTIQSRNWEERQDIYSIYISSFPCDAELQNHINKMATKYEVPPEVLMTLIDQESGGYWNCNGVISKTNDYGLAQINKCMLPFIEESIGLTKDDILNNPYAAVEAEAFVVRYCFDKLGYDLNNFDYRSAFGCYNGWVTWEKKEPCRKYADKCMERLEKHFGITDRYVHNELIKK